jgi:hypothetical protein
MTCRYYREEVLQGWARPYCDIEQLNPFFKAGRDCRKKSCPIYHPVIPITKSIKDMSIEELKQLRTWTRRNGR